jgi:hypothetical protein
MVQPFLKTPLDELLHLIQEEVVYLMSTINNTELVMQSCEPI